MESRVTLMDVARATGVHRTTVARALRGHPGIPAATRERIQEAARGLGYTPDPALQALTLYRLKKRPPKFHGVIAWLDTYARRGEAARLFDQHRAGAAARAEELGYRLEDFWLREAGMTADRLSRILRQRGIEGILVAPLPAAGALPAMRWEWFSLVGLSPTIQEPRIHLVHNAQQETMREIVEQLFALGYRRPLLALPRGEDDRLRNAWTLGFRSATERLGLAFAGHVVTLPEPVRVQMASLVAGLHRTKADALIFHGRDLRPALRRRGFPVPERLGCAWTEVRLAGPGASGAAQQERLIGASAVDLLHSCLIRGERGVPEHQLRLLVSSSWSPGTSVRRQDPP